MKFESVSNRSKNISYRTYRCKQIETTRNWNRYNLHFFFQSTKAQRTLNRPTDPPTLIVIATGRLVRSTLRREREREIGSRQNWIYSAGYAIRATDVLRALPTLQLYSRSAGFIARAIGQFLAFGSVLIDEIQPDTFGRDWPESIGRNSCLCVLQQCGACCGVENKLPL
jgi:hypothetical protein